MFDGVFVAFEGLPHIYMDDNRFKGAKIVRCERPLSKFH